MTKNPIAVVGSLPNKSEDRIIGSYKGPGGRLVDTDAALKIAIDIVLDITCEHFGVIREELIQKKGSKRNNAYGAAKRFFYAACMTSVKRIFPKSMSYVRSAAELGADHSTSMHHVKTHYGFMDTDKSYRDNFGVLIAAVESALDNTSIPVLIATRENTINEIKSLYSKLKVIESRIKAQGIDTNKLKPQITVI